MGFLTTLLRRGQRTDRDSSALAVLRKHGFDAAEPVMLRHFLYFAREYEARVIAAELAQEGFETDINLLPMDGGMLVLARRTEPLDEDAVRTLRNKMEIAAWTQKGEYDGWEAETPSGEPVAGAVARR